MLRSPSKLFSGMRKRDTGTVSRPGVISCILGNLERGCDSGRVTLMSLMVLHASMHTIWSSVTPHLGSTVDHSRARHLGLRSHLFFSKQGMQNPDVTLKRNIPEYTKFSNVQHLLLVCSSLNINLKTIGFGCLIMAIVVYSLQRAKPT